MPCTANTHADCRGAVPCCSIGQVLSPLSHCSLLSHCSHIRTCLCPQVSAVELEHKTPVGSIDLLVRYAGVGVAVEVDGPMHYAANR